MACGSVGASAGRMGYCRGPDGDGELCMSGYGENHKTAIVALLADGHYHSGQWLADQLAISRTAVWKIRAKPS